MPRPPKRLKQYDNPPLDLINEDDFDRATKNDPVSYICLNCDKVQESKKRLIAARIINNRPLLCPSCKNKKNRTGSD